MTTRRAFLASPLLVLVPTEEPATQAMRRFIGRVAKEAMASYIEAPVVRFIEVSYVKTPLDDQMRLLVVANKCIASV